MALYITPSSEITGTQIVQARNTLTCSGAQSTAHTHALPSRCQTLEWWSTWTNTFHRKSDHRLDSGAGEANSANWGQLQHRRYKHVHTAATDSERTIKISKWPSFIVAQPTFLVITPNWTLHRWHSSASTQSGAWTKQGDITYSYRYCVATKWSVIL